MNTSSSLTPRRAAGLYLMFKSIAKFNIVEKDFHEIYSKTHNYWDEKMNRETRELILSKLSDTLLLFEMEDDDGWEVFWDLLEYWEINERH